MVAEISQDDFKSRCKEGKSLFVFGAAWCPDCVRINPFLDSLSEEFNGRVNLFKISINRIQELDASLNIRKIPTLMFFNNGVEVLERLIEPQRKEVIAESLNALADLG